MTSTLWIVQKIGQLSDNIAYDESDVTYNDPNVQYGGTRPVLWIEQDGGQ